MKIYHNASFFQTSDIDECVDNSDSCHADAVCTNTKGAYNCTCNNGYEGDGFNCTGKDLRCLMFAKEAFGEG